MLLLLLLLLLLFVRFSVVVVVVVVVVKLEVVVVVVAVIVVVSFVSGEDGSRVMGVEGKVTVRPLTDEQGWWRGSGGEGRRRRIVGVRATEENTMR